MFFTLILENESGDRVDMTTTANNFMVSKIEGLSPPTGTISTSSYAGMDGSYLNNAFIEKRNVVIHFEMRGVNIESRRHALYRAAKPSHYIKVYYRTAGTDVFTEGYVETCEVNHFEQCINGQISILCPDIYWYATETQVAEYSQVIGAFHFIFPDDDNPFPIAKYNTQNIMTIKNDGDETGCTIVISGGPAKNPTLYNTETDEYMQIQGEIEEGDTITITTKTGNKTVTLEREGVTTNIINRLVSGSTWLTLREGENHFRLTAVGGTKNLKVQIIHRNAYLGV
jgi:frataxin-like iron-binding protein CyaY